jgi:RNA polymerase sigma factor (sigma-70 family)
MHDAASDGAMTPRRIERAVSGDQIEMDALVESITPPIRARVLLRLRRSGVHARCGTARYDVEDLTQDVLLKLFRDRGAVLRRWQPARGLSLPGFVAMIAQNHVASVLSRAAARCEFASAPEKLSDRSVEAPRIVQRCEAVEAIEKLSSALRDRISERAMRVFELLLVEQRPVREVCSMLSISRSALYTLAHRVRRQLTSIAVEMELFTTHAWLEQDWR